MAIPKLKKQKSYTLEEIRKARPPVRAPKKVPRIVKSYTLAEINTKKPKSLGKISIPKSTPAERKRKMDKLESYLEKNPDKLDTILSGIGGKPKKKSTGKK